MTRTRTLLIIGVFMLSLAVLAGLEWSIREPVKTEGQMVTGTLDRSVPPAPEPSSSTQSGLLPADSTASGGVFVPLDNGTLRGESGSSLDMTGTRPPLSQSAAPTPQESVPPLAKTSTMPEDRTYSGQIPDDASAAPAENPAVPAPEALSVAPRTEKTVTEQAEPSRTGGERPAVQKRTVTEKRSATVPTRSESVRSKAGQPGEFVLTAGVPRLAAGQSGASSSLTIGKNVVLQLKGQHAMKAKTLLLREPDRFVVDIDGNWGIGIPQVPDGLWLKNIRVGHNSTATRIVFDLTRKPTFSTAKNLDAGTLEIEIR